MPESFIGTVWSTRGGVYRVALEDGRVVNASLRGRLKRETRTGGRVVIGDVVDVVDPEGDATIERVHERETVVARRLPGRRTAKAVAANLDALFVVASLRDPPPIRQVVDRLLVIAEACRVEGLLVINKLDLGSPAEAAPLAEVYRDVGYRVFTVSAADGTGLEGLREAFRGHASALLGPSGVGKSALLNALEPGLELRTGGLSRRSRRGRHTTVSARMIRLSSGGVVADTPGFSDVALWKVPRRELASCFPEFHDLEPCRFRSCVHVAEPDCAVLDAVERGVVDAGRYESYRVLLEESED